MSLEALATVAADQSRWPQLRRRLDKFFGGGLLSEKFYYSGLSVQYVNKIIYDDLDDFVKQDQQQRMQAMEDCLSALESMQSLLAAQTGPPPPEALTAFSEKAKGAIIRWFSLVPDDDLQAVDALLRAVGKADVNRDGRLDDKELATMQPAEQTTWQRRVALVGD